MSRLRRRVAILGTRGYPSFYGGFETAVRHLAPYMADCGWEVSVYGRPGILDASKADPRVHSIITRGVETKSLSTLSYGLTSTIHAAARRPDVALVMNVANGFWLPLLRARHIPTVVNVDGIEWERDKWGKAARRLFLAGAKATAMWSENLVFDSREISIRWNTQFGRSGTFIPYGGQAPIELNLNDPPRRDYALLVARLVPENTVVEFFDAIPEISRTLDVVIVGSSGYGGELDARARQLAATLPGVRWLGQVHDDSHLNALWRHSAVYFHGHSVGGTNPALVQAMACGAPVVARDSVYNREVLGTAGRFVSPDAASIRDALLEVAGSPSTRRNLGEQARARQQEHYTWEAVCEDYERLIRTAAEGNR